MAYDPTLVHAMEWRCIGPPRGGRVVAVAGDPSDPAVFYFGACAGGVWKTDDAGTYWRNVSDGFFRAAAVGAIAVSQSDPSVIYAGTGESCTRNDVSHGDGVYRSSDSGLTWVHCGLDATRHIARVRIHPHNPDIVYVAALGDIFGSSDDRGVYRSRDGGHSWELVLRRSDTAGCCDLILDPRNPRILYAAFWEARRTPWSMSSGGAGSGMWRSNDGGDTWTDLTRKPGMPRSLLGRIGVAVAPAKPGRAWALIEAGQDEGGLYRTDDGGERWERVSEDKALLGRPWYYSHIVADPQDPDTIYACNLGFWKSSDAGRTFRQITTPHGDNHDLWINPVNTRRMIEGNDGGACVSFNGGESWSSIYNQPTGQFYHVAVDDRTPYRVYGTQQDNSAISVPSRSTKGAIVWGDCYRTGHSESGHIAVDPRDPDIVYSGAVGSSGGGGGSLLRYNHRTEENRNVTVWPEYFFGEGEGTQKHRFQWTFPIVFSPHDPSVLYVTGERVFRTTDGGASWDAISPDLTRADPERMKASGGPISIDTSGAEHYCTVYAFTESPHEAGVLWAGSDDGLVHVSRDGGENWTNVTPPGLPEWATVTVIEPSPFDRDTVYVAAVRYKLQDRQAYVFRTTDGGGMWERITAGIPEDEWIRIVRCDPVRRGLLYAGSETRPYVSFDDGASWHELALNMPRVPIYDLVVKDDDLVAASHGRGFWILDDLTPLRELALEGAQAPELFVRQSLIRYLGGAGWPAVPGGKSYLFWANGAAFEEQQRPDGERVHRMLDAGKNPRYGVTVVYRLDDRPGDDEIALDIVDNSGAVVQTFTPDPRDLEDEPPSEEPEPEAEVPPEQAGEDELGGAAEIEEVPQKPKRKRWRERLPRKPGFNRFTWDLRAPGFHAIPDESGESEQQPGPRVPPGRYTVRLRVREATLERTVDLLADPRSDAAQDDLDAQYELLCLIRDKVDVTHAAIGRLRKVKNQVEQWSQRTDAGEEITDAAKTAARALTRVEDVLTNRKVKHDTDRLKMPAGLDRKLAEIPAVIQSSDSRPTKQSYDVFDSLSERLDRALADLDRVVDSDVAALNEAISRASVTAVDVSKP